MNVQDAVLSHVRLYAAWSMPVRDCSMPGARLDLSARYLDFVAAPHTWEIADREVKRLLYAKRKGRK